MPHPLILASGSEIRATLLRNAAVEFTTVTPRIDEDMVRDALLAEDAKPRDIADTLAELKARKLSARHPDASGAPRAPPWRWEERRRWSN